MKITGFGVGRIGLKVVADFYNTEHHKHRHVGTWDSFIAELQTHIQDIRTGYFTRIRINTNNGEFFVEKDASSFLSPNFLREITIKWNILETEEHKQLAIKNVTKALLIKED